MDFKYTSDGKKVVIVGKLNSQETIVQEVFVSGGSEIPSGEQFIVKSLHDKPAKSWKEKDLEKLEARYEQTKSEIARKSSVLWKKENTVLKALGEKVKQLSFLEEKISPEGFQLLSNFILGKIKYAVAGYDWSPKLIDFSIEKDLASFYDGKFESLKLLSLMGKSNGDLEFNINRYNDGSGGSEHTRLFCTVEEAKEFFVNIVAERKYSDSTIKELRKWDIPLDAEKLEEYKVEKITGISKTIATQKKRLEELEQQLKGYEEIKI